MRSIIRFIDSISEWTGKIVQWFVLLLVVVIVYEVTARYVFNAPTVWAFETTCFLLCIICCLGWVYTHVRQGHVRVDVFYERLSPRGRAFIDVCGYLIFFFPLLIILIPVSATGAWFSFTFGERGISGFWYPPLWPIRAVMIVGVFLFFLQGVAQFTRDLYLLIRDKPL